MESFGGIAGRTDSVDDGPSFTAVSESSFGRLLPPSLSRGESSAASRSDKEHGNYL